MLTPIRRAVFETIADQTEARGYPPSVREIAVAVGRSPSTVHWHLSWLEEQGYVRRTPGAARAVVARRTSERVQPR